jgi:hypothetical protein
MFIYFLDKYAVVGGRCVVQPVLCGWGGGGGLFYRLNFFGGFVPRFRVFGGGGGGGGALLTG